MGGLGGDGVEKFDACAFFDAEFAAADFTGDFAVAADGEVAGAFDGAGQLADDGEVMTLECDAGDAACFLDDDIAASLNASVPDFRDLVIKQADVAAAFRALAGLRFGDGFVAVAAVETGDVARWLDGIEQPHEKGSRRRRGSASADVGLDFLSGGAGLWLGIGVFARRGEAGDGTYSDHAFAVADLEIRSTATALSGDHERGFGLDLATLGASHLDAMAVEVIGHDFSITISYRVNSPDSV